MINLVYLSSIMLRVLSIYMLDNQSNTTIEFIQEVFKNKYNLV